MAEGIPTERRWPSGLDIAKAIADQLAIEVPANKLSRLGERWEIEAMLESAYEAVGYTTERKISRLTERLKDAIFAGAFGPLVIPNTVDVDGNQIPTPVGEIAMAFRDIYTEDFLALFDEEGNLLDPDAGGA